jgi:hypothetical protein
MEFLEVAHLLKEPEVLSLMLLAVMVGTLQLLHQDNRELLAVVQEPEQVTQTKLVRSAVLEFLLVAVVLAVTELAQAVQVEQDYLLAVQVEQQQLQVVQVAVAVVFLLLDLLVVTPQ